MSRHHKGHGIPDRWLDYKAVGKRLHGTRFIAFKVPLKQALTRQLSSSEVFGPFDLMETLSQQSLELGLIIDLTFTKRYYTLQDVPVSFQCIKIFTAGHQVPSDETILSFKQVVRRFLRENNNNEKLIGVHCTHGLNRTGYLICRYLIDVDGMDPKEAIELFNCSRGHDLERQNYIEDLHTGHKRSNDGIDECELEPVRGSANQRPADCDIIREERRQDDRYSRSFPPRDSFHRSHHHSNYDHHHHLPPHHHHPHGNRPLPPPHLHGNGLLPPPQQPHLYGNGLLPLPLPLPSLPPPLSLSHSLSAYGWMKPQQFDKRNPHDQDYRWGQNTHPQDQDYRYNHMAPQPHPQLNRYHPHPPPPIDSQWNPTCNRRRHAEKEEEEEEEEEGRYHGHNRHYNDNNNDYRGTHRDGKRERESRKRRSDERKVEGVEEEEEEKRRRRSHRSPSNLPRYSVNGWTN